MQLKAYRINYNQTRNQATKRAPIKLFSYLATLKQSETETIVRVKASDIEVFIDELFDELSKEEIKRAKDLANDIISEEGNGAISLIIRKEQG